MRHRRVLVALGSTAVALATVVPADAHTTFGSQAGKNLRLAVSMPVEDPDSGPVDLEDRHNDKLKLKLPEGFKARSCDSNGDFKCKIKHRTITWTRRSSSDGFNDRDVFYFKVRTPKDEGLYDIPAIQAYSDGEVVAWDEHTPGFGEPGFPDEPEHPAPQVRVRERS